MIHIHRQAAKSGSLLFCAEKREYPAKKQSAHSHALLTKQLIRSETDSAAYLFMRYSSMAAAAFLPAPIARITVAAPVTASPPA